MAVTVGRTLVMHDVKVGGKPVAWTRATGTLNLAGDSLTIEEWLEARRRIDMLLKRELAPKDWAALREKIAWLGKRDRLPMELRDYEAVKSAPASGFLTHNLSAVNALVRGHLRRAPWWLRWRYDAVVTKEHYRGD